MSANNKTKERSVARHQRLDNGVVSNIGDASTDAETNLTSYTQSQKPTNRLFMIDAAKFESRNQSFAFCRQQIVQWILTAVLISSIYVTIEIYEAKGNLTLFQESTFQLIITALSLGLALNFFKALKDTAQFLQWRILAQMPYTSVGEVELTVGSDNLMNIGMLGWESLYKTWTLFLYIFWTCLDFLAQTSIALIHLTYSINDNTNWNGIYTRAAKALVPNLKCDFHNKACPSPNSRLIVEWPYLIALLAGITEIHFLLSLYAIYASGVVVVKEDSSLSTARLLCSLVGKLGNSGTAMKGEETSRVLEREVSDQVSSIDLVAKSRPTPGVGSEYASESESSISPVKRHSTPESHNPRTNLELLHNDSSPRFRSLGAFLSGFVFTLGFLPVAFLKDAWQLASWAIVKCQRNLPFLEPPLKEGELRVRWTCRCGKRLYDDFREIRPGAAEELAKLLNHRHRPQVDSTKHPNEGLSASDTPTDSHNLHLHQEDSLDGSGKFKAAASAPTSSTGTQIGDISSTPAGDSSTGTEHAYSVSQRSNPGQIEVQFLNDNLNVSGELASHGTLFLLSCIRISKYATSLLQLDLKQPTPTVSDRQLLELLRTKYRQMRYSGLRNPVSLQTLTRIDFVQFELHRKSLVDIRKRDDMPPASRKNEYHFRPLPAETIPPVGRNFLTHIYNHPEDADQETICLTRFPKRIMERLKLGEKDVPVGWGIEFVEGIHWNKVWCFGFVIVVLSLILGILWSCVNQDVQGGFTIAGYMMAFLTFTAGMLQTMDG